MLLIHLHVASNLTFCGTWNYDTGSPDDEVLAKRRRTRGRGREFVVKIEFAAKIRMRAIEEMMRGKAGAVADRAQDALRVLDIVLRETASER